MFISTFGSLETRLSRLGQRRSFRVGVRGGPPRRVPAPTTRSELYRRSVVLKIKRIGTAVWHSTTMPEENRRAGYPPAIACATMPASGPGAIQFEGFRSDWWHRPAHAPRCRKRTEQENHAASDVHGEGAITALLETLRCFEIPVRSLFHRGVSGTCDTHPKRYPTCSRIFVGKNLQHGPPDVINAKQTQRRRL